MIAGWSMIEEDKALRIANRRRSRVSATPAKEEAPIVPVQTLSFDRGTPYTPHALPDAASLVRSVAGKLNFRFNGVSYGNADLLASEPSIGALPSDADYEPPSAPKTAPAPTVPNKRVSRVECICLDVPRDVLRPRLAAVNRIIATKPPAPRPPKSTAFGSVGGSGRTEATKGAQAAHGKRRKVGSASLPVAHAAVAQITSVAPRRSSPLAWQS